ncbi:MAG: glycosyltransferase family 2 protein [Leadbetterella sp.]|nr:glycosyltransferase family 2 protein [Leadbetterella sp.]
MKALPKISVLMSVFNTDFLYIKRALDSVFNQDYQNFEVIVIDDGSQNDSQQKILAYAIKKEEKLTYLRHQNCGQAESINRGVLLSTGDFITIIDADDEYKPNHLTSCLNAITDFDLIASNTETITNGLGDYYVPDKYNHNQLVHVDDCILFATLFGKKEVFTNIQFKKRYAADAFFFEEAKQYFSVKKVDLRTYIYYRNSASSICSRIKSEFPLNMN